MTNKAAELYKRAVEVKAQRMNTEYLNIIQALKEAANEGKFFIVVKDMYPENINELRAEGFSVIANNGGATISFANKYE